MSVPTPRGRVVRDAEGMRLEFRRSYPDSPADVWSALTDPTRLGRWFGTWTGDPASGTVDLLMTAEEGAEPQTVTIVDCDEPRRLVVDVPAPDDTWRLEVTLTSENGGTSMLFAQRLAEPYDAGSIGPGWHYYLDRLAAVLAGTPVPDDWDAYYPSLRSAYPLPD